MSRYYTRPARAFIPDAEDEWYEERNAPSMTVHSENEDRPTGVLDASGMEIWRAAEPVGFIRGPGK